VFIQLIGDGLVKLL